MVGEELKTLRHSVSHIMAQAVLELFPQAKLGIGPPTDEGFYYDFELPRPLTQADLPLIEERMRKIVSQDLPFICEEITKSQAERIFALQPYKLELLREIEDEKVTIYRQGDFVDLCRGPHIERTGQVKAFKLLSVAGAYWRGDERRPMLQRIYGTAFFSKEELDGYLKKLEEQSSRDHRKIGRELDLFSLNENIGPGLVLWHPKGALIRKVIEDFWKEEHLRRGYEIVYTPHIARAELWQKSRHIEMYEEYLYSPIDIEGQEYLLKPMNCPFHIMIYKSRRRSYREFPLRWAELGMVYRYERSGVLHGLARVRGFTQDDAHIFCREDQLGGEIIGVLEFVKFMLSSFGFEQYDILLSTRPEKYVGTIESWEMATKALEDALHLLKLPYAVDPGQGVFYGPKIDVKLKDALGRGWQGPTIQVDFNLPRCFEVTYIGADGKEHYVVMIHRTVLGSLERFLACLVEHYKGAFPVWLSPVQARLIPISERHLPYAQNVYHELKEGGIRVEIDDGPERMNYKIRRAQLEKIPYMLIIGDREVSSQTISIRRLNGEQMTVRVEEFKELIKKEASHPGKSSSRVL